MSIKWRVISPTPLERTNTRKNFYNRNFFYRCVIKKNKTTKENRSLLSFHKRGRFSPIKIKEVSDMFYVKTNFGYADNIPPGTNFPELVKSALGENECFIYPDFANFAYNEMASRVQVIGPVNGERGYLRDIIGNRHFWIVKVH